MNLNEPDDHDRDHEEEPPLNGPISLPILPIYDPRDELDDEFDDEDLEEGPRTVLITGASGNIGRKLRAVWGEDYDLVLLDIAPGPDDSDVIAADLTELDEEWLTHFHGVDTVIHLAGNADESASWDELVGPNIDALSNVLHASALAGVERVIFASSNHAMGGYRDLDDGPIDVARPPRPDSPYGASKLVGERLGRSLASAFDMTFIALRLGAIQQGENQPETLPDDDWSRGLWLSDGDLVRLFEGAVESDLDDRDFLVVNGMSNNQGMRWDLSDAIEWLDYHPEDDAFSNEPRKS